MPAQDNEKIILSRLIDRFKLTIEKATSEVINDTFGVSVDFIWKEKDLTILFEVDSYNSAKNIFGEYVLLNQVNAYQSNCILVIIHCYKKYNIERTKKYLKFAMDKLKCTLPFAVFDNITWYELVKTKSKTQLINFIKKSLTL